MQDYFNGEENLARRGRVNVIASVLTPTGGAARTPEVLLNETVHQLDGHPLADFAQSEIYDTYDGQNQANDMDWYLIEFPEAVTCNCIEMTMGWPYRDGGWWTSFSVEFLSQTEWRAVETLNITPPYDFSDIRGERRPYETYALTFGEVTTCAVRIIGQAGGIARFTSLARLAVYYRDLSQWNPLLLPDPPVPQIFRLITPNIIWDISKGLVKLAGLTINVPLMEYYLDAPRYEQFWQMVSRNYAGEPELWFLIADSLGWYAWQRLNIEANANPQVLIMEPHVRHSFHDLLASAVAPIVVNGQLLGEISTEPAILNDTFDWSLHQHYAGLHGFCWEQYRSAVERTPRLKLSQMEGVAELLGMIANTIVDLAQRNSLLTNELAHTRHSRLHMQQWKEVIGKAVTFMQENLESSINVADVAQALSLSPSYFCLLFTEHTGRSPNDFLIHLRVERAKKYLTYTHMSVMEICVALGYDPSYFNRLFKRYTGCTPGQYAQRARPPTSTVM